jgi:hypothetical protein
VEKYGKYKIGMNTSLKLYEETDTSGIFIWWIIDIFLIYYKNTLSQKNNYGNNVMLKTKDL